MLEIGMLQKPLPGLISQVLGGGNDAPQFPTPSFSSELITTIVPEFGSGSLTPTLTRATTATGFDFEGKAYTALSGEARMFGARRVYNLIADSTNLLAASWIAQGAGSATAGITAPDGTTTAFQLDLPANGDAWIANGVSYVAVGTATASVFLKADSAGQIKLASGNGTQVTTTDVNVTTEWRRYATTPKTGTSIENQFWIRSLTGMLTKVYAWHPQVEYVNGTNTNPSEYVSTGDLSAPYHGANVDGVKYFDTLNGNTVASNVVTEATGAHIDSSQAAAAGGVTAGVVDASGPIGFYAEGARTNDILQSNTLGTTWTVSNAADMEAVAADAYVSVDGATTMDKLQPKATTAVHSLNQAFTFTAAKYTAAADLRYVSATPQRWVALILNDGTTTWGASFDLLNGVAGAVSAGATSTIEATALANVYRVSVTNTANAAAAAGTVKISLNATDTATLESAARAGTETLGVGMVQLEIGTFKSSRITTTTVAVTRNADVLTYPAAGNIGLLNTSFAEVSVPALSAYARVISTGNAAGEAVPLYISEGSDGKVSTYTGATVYGGSSFSYGATVHKIASVSGPVGLVAYDGAVTALGADTTGIGTQATIGIGNNPNGLFSLFGSIRNARVYFVPLTAQQQVAATRSL